VGIVTYFGASDCKASRDAPDGFVGARNQRHNITKYVSKFAKELKSGDWSESQPPSV